MHTINDCGMWIGQTPKWHSSVYDGHKLYDVSRQAPTASEKVNVPAGDLCGVKEIGIRVFDGGVEMKTPLSRLDTLANNAARLPVLLKALCPSPPRGSSC